MNVRIRVRRDWQSNFFGLGLLACLLTWMVMFAPPAGARVSPSHPDRSNPAAVPSAPRAAHRNVIQGAPGDVKNLNTTLSYPTIADAINAVTTLDGHVLEVQVASHNEGLVTVNKSVTIQGMAGGSVVHATTNTGNTGDARGWFLVTSADVTFKNLTFEGESGTSVEIYQAIRFRASGGLVQGCTFQNIQASAGSYEGRGVEIFDANVSVEDCTFSNIGRIGVHIFGGAVTTASVNACTYTGKGAGDWLDYGVEIGGGANATISENTITACTGVALSDGSSSAGVLATDFFAPGTTGQINNNFLNGNTDGIKLGFVDGGHPVDATVVVASGNDLSGNATSAVSSVVSGTVDASGNWWGTNVVASVAAQIDGNPVDFTPWLDNGTDTDAGTGFQGDFSTLHVDDDSPQTGTVGIVQEGVNLVSGSTVLIGPGTYVEQVDIDEDTDLIGSGVGVTIIKSPASLTAFYVTPTPTTNNNYPVIFAHDANNIRIQALTVDGDRQAIANYRFVGIGYFNAGGRVLNVAIQKIEDGPSFTGAQHGVGLGSFNNTGGPYTLEVASVAITDFQKNGMTLAGPGLTVDVHDCSVTGHGYTTLIAQNGIQFSSGAGGSIARTAISDIGYSPQTVVACGVLVFGPGVVNVSDLKGPNAITNVQAPVFYYDANGDIDGVQNVGGADFEAIFIYNSGVAGLADAARLSATRARQVSGLDAGSSIGASDRSSRALATFNVTVENSCLDGVDAAGTVGIGAETEGGPLSVAASNNSLTDWEAGFRTYGSSALLTANENSVTSNVVAGYDNTGSTTSQNAENNWWGSASGPSGDGSGTGDAVLGGNVDFTPWLIDGTNLAAGCGFSPNSTTSLTSDVNPSTCGQKVTLTATVLPSGATGSVEFFDGVTSLGTAPVSSGVATLSVTTFTAGSHNLTARYSGDHNPSTSDVYVQVVNPIPTITALAVDPPKASCGGKVTLTATVSPNDATGFVEFNDQGGTPAYFEGFETGLGGEPGWDHPASPNRTPTRVPSGTNGVTSPTGAFHAEAGQYDLDNNGGSAFTRWGGYSGVFPTGGYSTQVDVYLDVAVAASAGDKRIDWTSAISDPSASYRRDFVFNMGTEPTGFVITGGNNAGRGGANPADPGHDPFHITQTGWYTLKHRFYSDNGVLAVRLSILDASGNVLHSWLRRDPSDVIGVTVGGNRYGWFAAQELPFLAFDNSARTTGSLGAVSVLNGVATLSLTDLPIGSHTIIATYTGDGCHSASLSDKVAQEVNVVTTTTTLTSDPNPSSCGDKVTLTASVAPGGATGTVTFFDVGAPPKSLFKADPAPTPLFQSDPNPVNLGMRFYSDVSGLVTSVRYYKDAANPGTTFTVALWTDTGTLLGTAVDTPPLGAGWRDVPLSPPVAIAANTNYVTAYHSSSGFSYTPGYFSGHQEDNTPLHAPANGAGSLNGPYLYGPANQFPNATVGSNYWVDVAFTPATVLGTEPLAGGQALLSVTDFTVGQHSLTALYSGDACHTPSVSQKTIQVVNPATVTVLLESDNNPSNVGEKVNFNATLSSNAATGTVEFFDGATSLKVSAVVNGVATTSISDLTVGTHSITAVYSGDACYATATSNKVAQAVGVIPTSVVLTTAPNPSQCGDKVTLTATVDPAVATGTVEFFDGATSLGPGVPTGPGTYELSIATLSAGGTGDHSITAAFTGTGNYGSNISNKVLQHVNKLPSSVVLSSDISKTKEGNKVTFTATVSPLVATGTVDFNEGTNTLSTQPVVNGVATYSISTLAPGYHILKAAYSGDDCYASSFSDTVGVFIRPDNPPVVTVIAPNGGENWAVGTTHKLEWTATDDNTLVYVDLYVARDGVNGNYEKIASMLTNPGNSPSASSWTGTYDWLVTGPGTNTGAAPQYTAFFKVVGVDDVMQPGEDKSDEGFSIFDGATATMLAMFQAEPVSAGVELRWRFAAPEQLADVALERADGREGPWARIAAEMRRDGDVTVAFDRAPTAGHTYFYRLVATDLAGVRTVFGPLSGTAGSALTEFSFSAAKPNPTHGPTTVEFALPKESRIRLSVMDVQGRELTVLAEGVYRAGRYQATWNGIGDRGAAPVGLYFLRLQAAGKTFMQRLVLSR